MKETQSESPTQTSRHTTVRQEISIFSNFSKKIREKLTSNEISHKHDLIKILALFTIQYFVHDLDLLALSGTSFRPQNSDDETVLAVETDYVWDPDWSHPLFFIYQLIYQIKQLPLFPSIKTTLDHSPNF